MRTLIVVCAALLISLFMWSLSTRREDARVTRAHGAAVETRPASPSVREESSLAPVRMPEESARAPVLDHDLEEAHTHRARSRLRGIRGRVLIGDRPAPKVSILVQADSPEANTRSTLAYSEQVREFASWWSGYTSDKHGGFLVAEVAAGPYALRFEHPRAGSKILRCVMVPEDGSVDLGDIVLDQEAIVRGSILPPVDESPSIIRVKLDGAEAKRSRPPSAQFEFSGLTAGVHDLEWGRQDTDRSRLDRMRVEVRAGEVRDVIVDATRHAAARLVVCVTANGRPAGGIKVGMLTSSKTDWMSPILMQDPSTDEKGIVVLRVPPGRRFTLEARGQNGNTLGSVDATIELESGEERALTIPLVLGTVVVQLPQHFRIPKSALITVELIDARDRPTVTMIDAAAMELSASESARTNRIDCGSQPAGSYRARVQFNEVVQATGGVDGRVRPTRRELRAPFETRLVVEAGREAVIAVPD